MLVAADPLPRLLYIGDVPVSETFGGAIFLHRLLRDYPADSLVVCAPSASPHTTLPGVRYVDFQARWPRILHTRFSEDYCAWITWRLDAVPRWASALASAVRPDVIITISQTGGWLLAWRVAQRFGIPLAMFIHDDEVFYRHLPVWLWPWAKARFARAYRDAGVRFCVSRAMAEVYERRYQAAAETQYPFCDPNNPSFSTPRLRTGADGSSLTFAYAGSIHGEPNLQQLVSFGHNVAKYGHRLVVYSPQYRSLEIRAAGARSIECRAPLATSSELIMKLREEADCLLATGNFDPEQESAVSTLFPSKLADYSSTGLPVIAWAPSCSSLSRFVRENEGVAELVTDPSSQALQGAVARLASSAELRAQLARTMIAVRRSTFSAQAARDSFYHHLRAITNTNAARTARQARVVLA